MGRHKGSLNKKRPVEKAHQTLQKITTDVVSLSLVPALEDGGATVETAPVVSKDSIARRISRRLNVLDRYLTDERLAAMLEISSLKEVAVMEAIMIDKLLLTRGDATVIVGSQDRANMNTLLPKLFDELKRRNIISATERRIAFQHVEA